MRITPRTLYWLKKLYRVYTATFRFRPVNQHIPDTLIAQNQPFIMVFWHNELISVPPSKRCYAHPCKALAMTSDSRDGSLVDAMCNAYGVDTVRGSSSKGGIRALRTMQKAILSSQYQALCIAVDGPRGPRHVVKPGAIYLAHSLELPIMTVRLLASPVSIAYKSWDQQAVPLPFARVHLLYGEPYYIRGELTQERIQEETVSLAHKLNDISMLP